MNRLALAGTFDRFAKDVLLVFAGSSLVNVLNLVFQLIVAHRLNAADFAAFNSLLSLSMLIAAPFAIVQLVVSKHIASLRARNASGGAIAGWLWQLIRHASICGLLCAVVLLALSAPLVAAFKFPSIAAGYFLALLVAGMCVLPVLQGGVQGLALFGWYTASMIFSGAGKIICVLLLFMAGFGMHAALLALVCALLVCVVISSAALVRSTRFEKSVRSRIDYPGIFKGYVPIALANICYLNLVNVDMVWAKYFFTSADSGVYAVSQMVGKIFLFLPGAISFVLFPHAAHLHESGTCARSIMLRAVVFISLLCIAAICVYNAFPDFVLLALTGKTSQESVHIGRIFSISMSLQAINHIGITYLLSCGRHRFIPGLIAITIMQNIGIFYFHPSLFAVQGWVCASAVALAFWLTAIIFRDKKK